LEHPVFSFSETDWSANMNKLKSRDDWPSIRNQWLDGLCEIPFLRDAATPTEIEEAFDALVDNHQLDAPALPTQASLRFVAIGLNQAFRADADESFR